MIMLLQNKKRLFLYSIFCLLWILVCSFIQTQTWTCNTIYTFELIFWRGFDSIGTSLFWWIAVQLPLFFAIIWGLYEWKRLSVFIYLKRGLPTLYLFLLLKVILLTAVYFISHLIIVFIFKNFLLVQTNNIDISCWFTNTNMPHNVGSICILQFVQSLVCLYTILLLYIVLKNEYISFILTLCGHIILPILGTNAIIPSIPLWGIFGNLLSWNSAFSWIQYLLGGVICLIIILLLSIFSLSQTREKFLS